MARALGERHTLFGIESFKGPADIAAAVLIFVFALGAGNVAGKLVVAPQLADTVSIADFASGALQAYPIILFAGMIFSTKDLLYALRRKIKNHTYFVISSAVAVSAVATAIIFVVSTVKNGYASFDIFDKYSITIPISLMIALAMISTEMHGRETNVHFIALPLSLLLVAGASHQLSIAVIHPRILTDQKIRQYRSLVCAEECKEGVLVTGTYQTVVVRYKGDVSLTYIPRDELKSYRSYQRIKVLGFDTYSHGRTSRRDE